MFSELTEEDLKKEVDIPLGHRLLLRKHLRQPSLSTTAPNSKSHAPSLTSQPIHSQSSSTLQQTQPTSRSSNIEDVRPPQKKPISTPFNGNAPLEHARMHVSSSLPSISTTSSPSSRISHASSSPSSLSASSSASSFHHPKEKHTGIVIKSRIITEISMEGLLKDKAFVDINEIENYEIAKGVASVWFTVGVLTEKSYKTSSSSGSLSQCEFRKCLLTFLSLR